MQPEITTIELRMHPLDPRRIGPLGLVEQLAIKLRAAVDDPALVESYSTMTTALLDGDDPERFLKVS